MFLLPRLVPHMEDELPVPVEGHSGDLDVVLCQREEEVEAGEGQGQAGVPGRQVQTGFNSSLM